MAKKNALGKGLAALMDEEEALENKASSLVKKTSSAAAAVVKSKLPAGIEADENGTLWVDPNILKPNPHQPRTYFDEAKLQELTESVKREGVLSPVIIEDAGDGSFYIIAGERRTRASKAAGLKKIPVQLRKFSDAKKLEVALVENIQRTDLNPIEEALAYSGIMELEGITQAEVALRVGKDRSTVANSMRLLKLPEDMQKSLAAGTLTPGHARALLSVTNSADQRVLYAKIQGQGLSVRQAEEMAVDLNGGSRAAKDPNKNKPKKPDTRDPDYIAIENKFIEKLGTKVQLKGSFERGTVLIEYFTKEDLNRIYTIISGEK